MSRLLILFGLLLLAFCQACKSTSPAEPVVATSRPAASILTIILKADPALDTLTVADIIRGPGSLRQDYPRQISSTAPGELLFSFLGPEQSVLRQTTLPYPGANRYEIPSEDGTIEAVTVPEADRVLLLRTQYSPSLRSLHVRGQANNGRPINQIILLSIKD